MLVIGVDGGTTKTVALVANAEGQIIGAARTGGSNWTGEDVEIPMAVVVDSVQQALSNAGLSGTKAQIGVFTLAGADWPEDHTRREAVLSRAEICERVVVKNDSFGGLRAGTDKPYGMVIAAGTGMNAAVITPAGEEWAFGYYETFGGAGTIAQDTFAAVLRAEDGRGLPTLLTRLVLERLKFPSVEAMLRAYIARTIPYQQMFSLVPLVFQAALAGDAVAASILVRQGEGLAEYATTMARRFGMTNMPFDVVLAGSVFKGAGPLLIDTITQVIHRSVPLANIVRAKFEPVIGSILLAYDALGVPVTEAMYANLAASMPGPAFFDTTTGAGLAPVARENDTEIDLEA